MDEYVRMKKQVEDLRTYKDSPTGDDGEYFSNLGWIAALDAMDHWLSMQIESLRRKGHAS